MIDRCQYRIDLDSAASHYDQFSNFFDASAFELSERLQEIKFSPTRIVELGCRSGRVSELLLSQKNEATIYSFDESQRMAELAKSRLKDKNASVIVSEIDAVPLQSNSVISQFRIWHLHFSIRSVSFRSVIAFFVMKEC